MKLLKSPPSEASILKYEKSIYHLRNTFTVKLEGRLGSVDGDRNGAHGRDRSLEGVLVALGNVGEPDVGCTAILGLVPAMFISQVSFNSLA